MAEHCIFSKTVMKTPDRVALSTEAEECTSRSIHKPCQFEHDEKAFYGQEAANAKTRRESICQMSEFDLF